MYKRLVTNDYEVLNDEGAVFAKHIKKCLTPLVAPLIEKGYSSIDIEHVLTDEIALLLAETRILRNIRKRKG